MCALVTLRDREEKRTAPVVATWVAVDDVTCLLQGRRPPEIIIASKITQPSSPVSLLLTGLCGHGNSRVVVHRVVPACSCYRCVDLSHDRDVGTTDYAIELPLFRRSVVPKALT